MAVKGGGPPFFWDTSSDTKPTPANSGAIGVELGTRKIFTWNVSSWLEFTGGGSPGGLSDGDYGDITVSGGATAFTIDNGAVSTAKLAANAVTMEKLARGSTSGHVLTSNGSGADPSYQAPPSSDPWTYVKLAADFTTSANTNTNVTNFNFTPQANQTYVVEGFFMVRTATATVGPRPGCAWPTGTSDGAAAVYVSNAANAVQYGAGNPSGTFNSAGTGVPTTTGSWPASLEATFITGASPSGTFQVTLASETAGTNVTIKAGSWIRYRTI